MKAGLTNGRNIIARTISIHELWHTFLDFFLLRDRGKITKNESPQSTKCSTSTVLSCISWLAGIRVARNHNPVSR